MSLTDSEWRCSELNVQLASDVLQFGSDETVHLPLCEQLFWVTQVVHVSSNFFGK